MSTRPTVLSNELAGYLASLDVREPEPMQRLAAASDALPEAEMRSSPAIGRFLATLVQLSGARRCFEVGTFTGYSALWVAHALPDDGELHCFDVSEQWPAVGKPFWQQAGVDHKITLRVGDAQATVRGFLDDDSGGVGGFDFGFIDADKTGYPAYYELGLELLKPGGVMLFDNALRHGDVANPQKGDDSVQAIREVNAKAHADERVESVLLPLGDGLLMVRKR